MTKAASTKTRAAFYPSSNFSRGTWFFIVFAMAIAVVFVLANEKYLAPLPRTLTDTGLLLVLLFSLATVSPKSLGPLFSYDLVRSARKGQDTGYRCLFLIVLFVALFFLYWGWFPGQTWADLFNPRLKLSLTDQTKFAQEWIGIFAPVQAVLVFLLTPLYTSGAITEEKEKRTLEFLLATDLTDEEIIWGIFGARMANLSLLLLTGLPVCVFFVLMGGLEIQQILEVYLFTFLMMLVIGSLSVRSSVNEKKTLSALRVTYLGAFIVLIPGIVWRVGFHMVFLSAQQTLAGQCLVFFLSSLVDVGIIFYFLHDASTNLRKTARAQAEGTNARFRPLSSSIGADEILQVIPLKPPSASPGRSVRSAARSLRHGIKNNPLLWKSIHREGGSIWARSERGGLHLVLTGWVIFALFGIAALAERDANKNVSDVLQMCVFAGSVVLMVIFLFSVGMDSAHRITREREQQTLDNLLTIPSERSEILFAKWLGCLLSARYVLWSWLVLSVFGLVTQAVAISSLLLMTGAVIVYGSFLAALGLWFSSRCRTTLRASLFSFLATIVLIVGPGTFYRYTSGNFYYPAFDQKDWQTIFFESGLSPYYTLKAFCFRPEQVLSAQDHFSHLTRVLSGLVGTHIYLLMTILLLASAFSSLENEKDSVPIRRG